MLSEYYSSKTAYNKISRGRLEGLLKLCGDVGGKTVLDVGCGEGIWGQTLKEHGAFRVDGVDISPASIELASKLIDRAVVVDLEYGNLPAEISATKYDLITISEVLEHLFYPEQLLGKLKPSLADGGAIIITVPNVLFWRNRLKIFFGNFEYTDKGLMDRGHIHFFSWRSLQGMIRSGGFEIVASAHHAPTRFLRPFKNLFPGLVNYQLIVKITSTNN